MEDPEDARMAELRRYEILDSEPEEFFDRLTQLAARICEVPIALISIVDEHRAWFKSCFGLEAAVASREASLCAHTIRGTEPLVVHDASVDPRFANSALVCGEPRIRFYAGVPLLTRQGVALGALCVVDRRPRDLTGAQLETLKLLAVQVEQQFELRRVAEELRRQSRSLERTQATAHIGGWELDLLTQTLSWSEETYRIHELTPAEYIPDVDSAIGFYAPASAAQIRRAVEALVEFGTPYDLELQLISKTGRNLWVKATGQRDDEIGAGRRIFGVFQDITERRNLESEILLIAQQEQNRISLDLHDDLGQALTGVSLMLAHVSTKVPSTLDGVHHELREIASLVGETVGKCRQLAHGLAPVNPERGGLPHALRNLGRQLEDRHGVKIAVDVHGVPGPMSHTVADHLYRIAQEALTNAVRHSQARKIIVVFAVKMADVVLSVTDDGQGLTSSPPQEGMGINIMRYRARLIGAVLVIERTERGGTRVTCRLHDRCVGEPDAVSALR